MPSGRSQLNALRRMIAEADHILTALPPLPEDRTARCHELLGSALALADDLVKQSTPEAMAAQLGKKDGTAAAKRGSEYFRQLAAKRKTRAGGRPRKES
jgi:hypothetical protein